MGLFTDPLVLVDGAAASRTFNFRAQLNEPNSIVGEYIEPAADVASDSKLVVKHTTSAAGIKRHLLQNAETFDLTADPTDGSAAIIGNVTLSHHPLATEAQIQDRVTLLIDAMSEPNFVSNMIRGLI